MELRINESSNELISEFMLTPMCEYLKCIAKRLDCDIDELCYLAVHDDFVKSDEEGWRIESFFPKGIKIDVCVTLHNEDENLITFDTVNFPVGVVKEVHVNGKIFFADYNASPIGMVTKIDGLW